MVSKISSYLVLLIPLVILTTAWRFADWRNWKSYYPTILFMLMVEFSSSILTYNHSLWYLPKNLFLFNHTTREFFMVIFGLSPMALLYLSRFPYKSSLVKQLCYIVGWIVVFWLIEGVYVLIKKTTYYNGWSYGWSLLLWCVLFPVLRIHHSRPLWAWLICVAYAGFIITHFHLPITKLK